jgi:lipid A 3-O-deacylase
MKIFAVLLLLIVPFAYAQDLTGPPFKKGSWAFEVWTGGAESLDGWTADGDFFVSGVRVTKVITDQHGSSWLRGSLAYGFDIIPVAITRQQGARIYGGGFNPLVLKWNLAPRRHFAPYFELAGGGLFSNAELPPDASVFNFTAQAGPGVQILLTRKHALDIATKFFHMSNATLGTINPGMNGIHVTIGHEWLK